MFESPCTKKSPSSETQIIEAIIASWHHVIKKDELQTLVRSMKKCCVVVIKNKGHPKNIDCVSVTLKYNEI